MNPLLRAFFISFIVNFATSASGLAAVSNLLNDKQIWKDENEESHALTDWSQGPVVMTMIYGDCKKTCPYLTFVKLREIQKVLDAKKISAQFIIGTFDPVNDTPSVLRHLKDVNATGRKNWHFIRGTSEQTHLLAQELGLGDYYEMDDHIVHKFRIVYFDPNSKHETAMDYQHKDVKSLNLAP